MEQIEINNALEQLQKFLPSGIWDKFKNSIQFREFHPSPYTSFMDRYLVYRLIMNNVIQCNIYLEGNEVFQYGVDLEKEETFKNINEISHRASLKGLNVGLETKKIKEIMFLNTYYELFSMNSTSLNELTIYLVIPRDKEKNWEAIYKLFESVEIFFSSYLRKVEPQTIPIFSNFKEVLKSKIISYPYKSRIRGVLAHFQIEDLSSYGKIMGEEFSGKLVKEVRATIQKKLKKSDVLYALSTRSFVAYLPDCDVPPVVQRFEDVYFKIDSMTIQFKLDFYEIKPSNIDDINYFDKVFGNEITVAESVGTI